MKLDLPIIDTSTATSANAALDPRRLGTLSAIADPQARAEALANQLETVFMGMMMKSMRATVPQGGLLGKGLGGQTYVEMLDQQWTQLGGLPRDPRFHEALVRQILESPDGASRVVQDAQAGAARPETAAAQK